MAKYIDIESLFNKHNNEIMICGRGSCGKQLFVNFITELVNEPPVDVVEVVRCKDCKWINKTKMICTNPHNRVFNTGKTVYSNNFCSYGAKMDKE